MTFTMEDERIIIIHNSLDNEAMIEKQIGIEDMSSNSSKPIYMTAKDALLFAKYLEIEAERILRNE